MKSAHARPVALISSLLHHPTMVGYNRYSVSLARELARYWSGGLAWVPLPSGIHPVIREQLAGPIAPAVRPGPFSRTLDWSGTERCLRPALWHVLTDDPVPLIVGRPVVVTCHGLPRWQRHRHMIADGHLRGTFWDYQDFLPSLGARFAMLRQWIATNLALRRATAIIADSEYVRWELVTKLGIRSDKIHVAYLAPDAAFLKHRPPDEVRAVLAKHGLPPQFVLGVASFSRTKNTAGLLRLAADLADAGLPPVVLVGPAGAVEHYTREAEAARLVPGKTVFLLRNIPDEELACLYRAARVFVNLAWEESFGLPIVEAMAGGTPVVGSSLTAVPEVIGTGGVVVNPADPEEVFAAVRGVLGNAALWAKLSHAARARAADFSWDRTARAVAAVYARVSGTEG